VAQDRMFSLAVAADLIRRGEVSSTELVDTCLARAAALDPIYHAHISVLTDEAREAARRADEDVSLGRPLGRLHGVPVTVKDAFLMRGTRTTVGTVGLSNYAPAGQEDATCVQRLTAAGAIVVAKANVGSGMSRTNADSARLPTARNPWRPDHTPGGSSSGSAVSLAIGTSYGSVGTDLGGSIRIPAAFTGVVGLKPTYGRVSQHGDVFGMATALEHVGPLARTVEDAALMLEVLAGRDPLDPTSLEAPPPAALSAVLHPDFGAVRLGFDVSGGQFGSEPDVGARV
jgi:Asp-tRNA(Asn)/Glu-tRNA(Gln) amidotransferase A subunit family amidase